MSTKRITHWNIALVAAVLTSGMGVFLGESTLLLLAIPAVVFTVYSHVTPTPSPTLAIERSLSENNLSHNQEVEVTVTLQNTGSRTLPAITVLDGVPRMLSVKSGTARHAAALEPGGETMFSYTVLAKHGIHHFEPASIALEDTSGSVRVETTILADTELACRSPIRATSLNQTAQHAGSSISTTGASGTEFSKIRSYQPGDPPNRVDWNRYARDRELTTVRFHEERSQTTVICLDARGVCYQSSEEGEPHAVWYERAAARELLATFSDINELIGIFVLGTNGWIAPNRGSQHIATIGQALEDPAILPLEPPATNNLEETADSQVQTFRTRLDRGIGVFLLSPLLDEFPVETVRTLQADGHSVTVLSPDVTASGTLGAKISRLQRANRIATLRRADISVVDWEPEKPLETVVEEGFRK